MTRAEYEKAVSDIEARNPSEPLLPTLRRGYTPGNVMFLGVALKRVPKSVAVVPVVREKSGKPTFQQHASETEGTERMLTRKIAEAYSLLRKTRNGFHTCTSQDQFARVSDEVQRVWEKEVQHAIARREHFRSTGQLDNEPSEKLPDNPVALSKHINSLRARVSQAKKAGQTERIAMLQSQLEAAGEKIKTMENDA